MSRSFRPLQPRFCLAPALLTLVLGAGCSGAEPTDIGSNEDGNSPPGAMDAGAAKAGSAGTVTGAGGAGGRPGTSTGGAAGTGGTPGTAGASAGGSAGEAGAPGAGMPGMAGEGGNVGLAGQGGMAETGGSNAMAGAGHSWGSGGSPVTSGAGGTAGNAGNAGGAGAGGAANCGGLVTVSASCSNCLDANCCAWESTCATSEICVPVQACIVAQVAATGNCDSQCQVNCADMHPSDDGSPDDLAICRTKFCAIPCDAVESGGAGGVAGAGGQGCNATADEVVFSNAVEDLLETVSGLKNSVGNACFQIASIGNMAPASWNGGGQPTDAQLTDACKVAMTVMTSLVSGSITVSFSGGSCAVAPTALDWCELNCTGGDVCAGMDPPSACKVSAGCEAACELELTSDATCSLPMVSISGENDPMALNILLFVLPELYLMGDVQGSALQIAIDVAVISLGATYASGACASMLSSMEVAGASVDSATSASAGVISAALGSP